MENVVYELGDSLYINATNRCTNACAFCVRNYEENIYGDLWLDSEPSPEYILNELKKYDLSKYKSIVFCGYGEPTYRLDVIEAVSKYADSNGLTTRINTNGHGDKINDGKAAKVLVDNIDIIGISLNEVNAQAYDELCHSIYGKEGFDIMIAFAKKCVELGGNVIFSIVDVVGEEKINKAKQIAQDIGAKLRVRQLI